MKINWTDNAIEDLKEIKAYISKDSEFYATRFLEKLIDGAVNSHRDLTNTKLQKWEIG